MIEKLFGNSDADMNNKELRHFLEELEKKNNFHALVNIISDKNLENRETCAEAAKVLKFMAKKYSETDRKMEDRLKQAINCKIENLALDLDETRYSADLLEFKIHLLKKSLG